MLFVVEAEIDVKLMNIAEALAEADTSIGAVVGKERRQGVEVLKWIGREENLKRKEKRRN